MNKSGINAIFLLYLFQSSQQQVAFQNLYPDMPCIQALILLLKQMIYNPMGIIVHISNMHYYNITTSAILLKS